MQARSSDDDEERTFKSRSKPFTLHLEVKYVCSEDPHRWFLSINIRELLRHASLLSVLQCSLHCSLPHVN